MELSGLLAIAAGALPDDAPLFQRLTATSCMAAGDVFESANLSASGRVVNLAAWKKRDSQRQQGHPVN
jgi:hypothetical protein